MWGLLKKYISAPIFPDKERTRTAYWLNFLLLTLLALIVGNSIAILIGVLDRSALVQILLSNAIGFAIGLAALQLMRRGYVRASAAILLALIFLEVTYTNAFIFQSIRTPNVMTYFALIPLAGLLLERRNMNILAALSVITISIIFYFEWQGILQPVEDSRTIFDDVVVVFFTIAINTVLLNASIQRVEEKAEESRRAAVALSASNRELQISQGQLQQARAELEYRVEQRTEELRLINSKLQREIEERQHLVEVVRQSETHWRSLAEYLPETIVTITPQQTIAFVNRAIGPRPPDRLIGGPATKIHHQRKYQMLLEQSLAHVLQTGEIVSYESEEIVERNSVWYINRVGAIRQEGQVTAFILIATDITEQKLAETAMHQAQKLESLGILAGGVAHDFNNLLAAILMQMASASAKLPPEHPASNQIQRTIMAAERAAELTRQMLNYAGRSPSESKLIDLNDLITDNIHLFSAVIPKTVNLDPELSTSIALMSGDKGQIQQLIMNLILNSAEAIGQKPGKISVITDMQELNGSEVQFGQWTGTRPMPGRYVRLEIRDTGCGMDNQTLMRIFDPFFTTKFTGRGLGLASVLGIIRAHKGGLHVSSAVGKGTTFTILFPAQVDVPNLLVEPPIIAPATMDNALILVIDDEEFVREALVDILMETGSQVLQAADGPKGIELFRQYEDKLSLVLLDLSMPEMSGEEVFYILQTINPKVPVLLVSGYSEQEVMERFVNKGLAGFIQKPFDLDSLLQQIQSYLHVSVY